MEEEYANKNTMLLDLLEKKDELSKRLIEYFRKNFDVNWDNLKKKYKKHE